MRRALLIATSEYQAGYDLKTPAADVALVRESLTARNFICETLLQPTFEQLEAAVECFSKQISDSEIAILFFAGHAYEHVGSGSVLPVDFPFPATGGGIHRYGYPVSRFEDAISQCRGASILILDACRTSLDNPEERRRWAEYTVSTSSKRELDNFIIFWSTSSGTKAWDGINNSIFATSFADNILRHDLYVEEMFAEIGKEVQNGPHAQRSWYQSTLKARYRISDLPVYSIKRSILTPLPALKGNLWLSRDKDGKRLAICGQSRSIFEFADGKINAVRTLNNSTKSLAEFSERNVVAVDSSLKTLILVNDKKELRLRDDPHVLRISPSGQFAVLLYNAKIELIELNGKRPRLKRRCALEWDAYGATFAARNKSWVVGSDGNIAWLDAQSGKLTAITHYNPWAGHLYDISMLANGNLVVVGGRGSVRIIQPRGGEPSILDPIDPSRASRRSSDTLNPAFRVEFSKSYSKQDFLFCDISPTAPLLAVGTVDGKVFLIDLRDGRIVKKLAISAEGHSVQGLAFLADGTLAVLSMDATLKFVVCS